jgi:CoA-transferase family III
MQRATWRSQVGESAGSCSGSSCCAIPHGPLSISRSEPDRTRPTRQHRRLERVGRQVLRLHHREHRTWHYLLHAEFHRDGIDYHYRDPVTGRPIQPDVLGQPVGPSPLRFHPGGEATTLQPLPPSRGLRIARALIARADVFLHNTAPGVVERLGLDAETLRTADPRLVVVNISGYGSSGPLRDRKAYDMLVQAESGMVSVTGTPDTPTKTGSPQSNPAGGGPDRDLSSGRGRGGHIRPDPRRWRCRLVLASGGGRIACARS